VTDFDIRYTAVEGGGRIAYGVSGRGPVVVVPPYSLLGSNFSRMEDPVVPALILAGNRVVRYDHLGAGLSDRSGFDFTLDGLLRELEAVVDALELDRFAVMGSGGTGPLVMRYAVDHPERVRALLLIRTWANGAENVTGDRVSGYRQALRGDWVVASQMYVSMVLQLTGAAVETQAALIRETCEQDTYLAFADAIGTHDVTALLPAVSAPTFVWGPSDDVFLGAEPYKELAAAIPGAQLQLTPMTERAQRDERLISFLASTIGDEAHAVAPPGGFQTILFTDLEGSTELTQRLGDEGALQVLRGHNTAVRGARWARGEAHRRWHHGVVPLGGFGRDGGVADATRPRWC
jgi:pimeloyl-ACP methyl ester carboxylesterase